MRGILFLIFAMGLFASLAGQFRAGSPARGAARHAAFDTGKQRVGGLKAPDSAQFTGQEGSIELQREADGHFYADVAVNGTRLHMLVDTGASVIALSREDAQSASIATSIGMNDVVGEGADGEVHGEFARLDKVELGPLTAQGLDAIVLDGGTQSLLGQNFLAKFDSVQIEGDRMTLRRNS